MPLPTNSSLVLLPSSKPGDALHAKPKHAVLVRMSSQTLDALESFPTQPQVQFQFGDSPGIFIGDTYFPIQYSPENSIHELYLRASSATKKTAPLKLYANVVGKLAVERELANELRDKIRESTQDAAAQRNNRTTVLLETPPDLPTNNKKRKDPPGSSSMFRKPLRPADKLKVVPAPPNPAPLNKPAVPAASAQRDLPVPLRRRMIQCLAVSDRTEDNITKLVAGADPTAAMRRDVQDLLEEIAEPIMSKSSDKSPKTYRLKPVSWKEARPYEWTGLSESERTSIARAARVAFQNLNIPESDPIWNHVRFRSPTSLNPSTSSDPSKASASNPAEDRIKKEAIAKRGVSSSRDTKDKKPKPKTDPKAEIMMKDESKPIRAPPPEVRNDPPRANPAERRVIEHTRTSSLDNRRNDPAPNRRAPDYGDRRPPAPELKSSKSSSRHDEPSPAAASSKLQRQAERSAAQSGLAPKIVEEKNPSSQRIKKIRRENALGGASDSEKERDRPHTQAERVKAKEKIGRRDMDDSPREEPRSASSVAKRKVAADYDNDDFQDTKAQKRRKTEPVLTPAQRERERDRDRERDKERDKDARRDRDRERERDRNRDIPRERERERDREDRSKDSTPINKRSQNESRTQAKPAPRASTSTAASSKARHDSPSPALKHSSSNNARGGYSPASAVSSNLNPSTASHKSGSAKPRRRSPVYTSSEEEEEEEVPLKTTARRPAATKAKPSAPVPTTSSQASRDREPSSKNLPTDHAALRARYNTSYLEYLTSLQQLMVQKGKLDTMLKSNDLGSSGSITDSEGDIELMDPEELAQLTSTHKRLREELESIQVAFERTTKGGEPLPPAPELLTV